jgi:hypothetical protein
VGHGIPIKVEEREERHKLVHTEEEGRRQSFLFRSKPHYNISKRKVANIYTATNGKATCPVYKWK